MKFFFLSLLCLVGISSAQAASLSEEIPYYGKGFYQDQANQVQNEDLKISLQNVLLNYHQKVSGKLDEIVSFCDGDDCYTHVSLGYDRSRIFLMGDFYLRDFHNGTYAIKDVYCDKDKVTTDFKKGVGPGPNKIPNGAIINIEHTWPQSRFSSEFDKDMQRSDMHHLFPSDTKLNAVRANLAFGEVVKDTQSLKCKASRVGESLGKAKVFEPPTNHRGNVARALFYFSVRYDLRIDAEQEMTLREWHVQDPVDEEETLRNEAIQEIQGNRNPFVDYPELVDQISDF